MLILIYGTIKQKCLGHDFLVPYLKNGDVELIQEDAIIAGYEIRLSIAPFLVRCPDNDSNAYVRGEIYNFHNEEIIKELDNGESWAYKREIIYENTARKIYAYVAQPHKELELSFSIGHEYKKEHDNFLKKLYKK